MTATDIAARLESLPAIAVVDRVTRLRRRMDVEGLDALVVTAPSNIRWLTGFTGSAGLVALTSDDMVLVTDARYTEQAGEQLAAVGAPSRIEITSVAQRSIVVSAFGDASRIGLESDHVTWSAQRRYATEWFDGRELVATSGLVEGLRRRKDDAELVRMELAALIADTALADIRHRLVEQPTEQEFAVELDTMMRSLGATRPSFETIVASGPNAAKPHARPGARRLTEGDLVILDFGCVVDGYCSDMTRTVALGDVDDRSRRLLDVVTAANAAGVAAVRAGVPTAAVDTAARSVIVDAGWGEEFAHGTGHGVGLDIHEAPRVGSSSVEVLEVGDVVTVEPGVYLPGHGGARMEDSVVVTADGCTVLTHTTKSPQP
jgi:Xaa-Pro aminopeptidase